MKDASDFGQGDPLSDSIAQANDYSSLSALGMLLENLQCCRSPVYNFKS
jgi:hypothetical protein